MVQNDGNETVSQYVDEWGNRLGYCNSCGEEAELYGGECCEDGEIVPYDDDLDPTD
jgi:hypothetical protein